MNQARFVVGTGTDVGKTIVSALLALRLKANYFKPIQSGSPTDSDFMQGVLGPSRVFQETYQFKNPLSPNQAAALEDITIDIARITIENKITKGPLIVEAAGGILSPLTSSYTVIDLMLHLQLKTILVARSGLGTITHTLQSVHILEHNNIPLTCIILFGPHNTLNKQDIEQRSGVTTFNVDEIKNLWWEDI